MHDLSEFTAAPDGAIGPWSWMDGRHGLAMFLYWPGPSYGYAAPLGSTHDAQTPTPGPVGSVSSRARSGSESLNLAATHVAACLISYTFRRVPPGKGSEPLRQGL